MRGQEGHHCSCPQTERGREREGGGGVWRWEEKEGEEEGGRRVNTCSTDAPWRDGEMERER